MSTAPSAARSTDGVVWELVYDGDCTFCRYCVDYARAVTQRESAADAPAVTCRAFQDAAADHADVTEEQFRASIQLFTPNARFQGARAALEVIALAPRLVVWLWLYKWLPGVSTLAEWTYRWVARHRTAVFRLTRLALGRQLLPLGYSRVTGIIVRGVGLCGLAAFGSFAWQADALIGDEGIMPVAEYFRVLAETLGARGALDAPSLYWLHASEEMTTGLCALGMLASALLVLRRYVVASALLAYAAYLSLFYGGRLFMAYQWDLLLLEAFVAVAVLGWRERIGIWVVRALVFRFMLCSGVVKLLSNDASWADLTALTHHFETQPLPTVVAWYAHALPHWMLVFATGATLVVELVLPWLVFAPRNARYIAAVAFIVFELLILVTGNYNFFNVLTIVLCVALLDDRRLGLKAFTAVRQARTQIAAPAVLAVFLLLGGLQLHAVTGKAAAAEIAVLRVVEPWNVVNRYGLFAVMTTERRELSIEWSSDGSSWTPLEFRFKPGALDAAPAWAAPHQPRLDWQMWFAALGPPEASPWIDPLLARLLLRTRSVNDLLAEPLPENASQVRVMSHLYEFTTTAERDATGDWWRRTDARVWLPPLRLIR